MELRGRGETADEAAVLADILRPRRARPLARRGAAGSGGGRASARHQRARHRRVVQGCAGPGRAGPALVALAQVPVCGYIPGRPGRHIHRCGHPSGPRARFTVPRGWRTKPRFEPFRGAPDTKPSFRPLGLSAGLPAIPAALKVCGAFGPRVRNATHPTACAPLWRLHGHCHQYRADARRFCRDARRVVHQRQPSGRAGRQGDRRRHREGPRRHRRRREDRRARCAP